MSALHSSLSGISGIRKDKYGNLKVRGVRSGEGLRHRYAFVMRLPYCELAKVQLGELLDWMRWGAQEGVMWECTMAELLRVIMRWERANPEADASRYSSLNMGALSWTDFWSSHSAFAYQAWRVVRCKCGRIFDYDGMFCPRCDASHFEGTWETRHLTRGLGHYNLAVHGAGGSAVAALAFTTRNRPRPIPRELPVITWS